MDKLIFIQTLELVLFAPAISNTVSFVLDDITIIPLEHIKPLLREGDNPSVQTDYRLALVLLYFAPPVQATTTAVRSTT